MIPGREKNPQFHSKVFLAFGQKLPLYDRHRILEDEIMAFCVLGVLPSKGFKARWKCFGTKIRRNYSRDISLVVLYFGIGHFEIGVKPLFIVDSDGDTPTAQLT